VACTDFSDPALPAVHAAAREAARTGARLIVVHAIEPVPHAMVGLEGLGVIPTHLWSVERRRDAEARLAAALAGLQVAGEYAAVEGGVVTGLVGLARERGAGLMVVGTVGRTGLTRFLLGSVAEAIVREAPCSTLVVRLHRRG
jgi:nucleotide-binding universal stress UspA family protein